MPWDDDGDDEGAIACRHCGDDLEAGDEMASHRLCGDCADNIERIAGIPLDEMTGW